MTEYLRLAGQDHLGWKMEGRGGGCRTGIVTVFDMPLELTVITRQRENHVDMEVGIGLEYYGGEWTTSTRVLQWSNCYDGEPRMMPNGFGKHNHSESYWMGKCATTRDAEKEIRRLFRSDEAFLKLSHALLESINRMQLEMEARSASLAILFKVKGI